MWKAIGSGDSCPDCGHATQIESNTIGATRAMCYTCMVVVSATKPPLGQADRKEAEQVTPPAPWRARQQRAARQARHRTSTRGPCPFNCGRPLPVRRGRPPRACDECRRAGKLGRTLARTARPA
jgi:hypothetical protein